MRLALRQLVLLLAWIVALASPAWAITPAKLMLLNGGRATSAGVCSSTIGGVSPSVCQDWQANTTTGGFVQTYNNCTTMDANGITCQTSGQYVEANVTFPSGSFMIVMKASYPGAGGSTGLYSYYNGTDNTYIYRTNSTGAIIPSFPGGYGGTVGTGPQSFFGISAYYSAGAWVCSGNGAAPVSCGNRTPTAGINDICFGSQCGNYGILLPMQHFMVFAGTFTTAQIQAASQL